MRSGPVTLPFVMSSASEPQTRGSRRAHAARTHGADPSWATSRPRPLVAVGVVATGLALAGAAASGERLLEVLVIVVAGLVVAVGWPRLVGSPTPVGSSLVLAFSTLTLGAALLARDTEPILDQAPAAVAAGVIAMCLHPLVQASARSDLARGLAGTALGVVLIACGGVFASAVTDGTSPTVVAGIALAVAALADLVTERPRSSAWMLPVGMVVGGAVGLLVHRLLSDDLAAWAALVGVIGAGAALSLRRATSTQPAIDTVPGGIAAGVASVLLVGPLLHLVSRLPIS